MVVECWRGNVKWMANDDALSFESVSLLRLNELIIYCPYKSRGG